MSQAELFYYNNVIDRKHVSISDIMGKLSMLKTKTPQKIVVYLFLNFDFKCTVISDNKTCIVYLGLFTWIEHGKRQISELYFSTIMHHISQLSNLTIISSIPHEILNFDVKKRILHMNSNTKIEFQGNYIEMFTTIEHFMNYAKTINLTHFPEKLAICLALVCRNCISKRPLDSCYCNELQHNRIAVLIYINRIINFFQLKQVALGKTTVISTPYHKHVERLTIDKNSIEVQPWMVNFIQKNRQDTFYKWLQIQKHIFRKTFLEYKTRELKLRTRQYQTQQHQAQRTQQPPTYIC